jgi:hypothetical protein
MAKVNHPKRCVLCLQDRQLQRSHVIPKFCIKPLREPGGKLPSFSSIRKGDVQYHIQDGPWAYLLCRSCEQLRNTLYEKPFRQMWYDSGILAGLGGRGEGVAIQLSHYGAFKLFHLSVVFLSAHLRQSQFQITGLTPQQLERMRVALLNNEPPPATEFGLFCSATRDANGNIVQYMAPPLASRVDECELVAMTYAGGEWYVALDPVVSPRMLDVCLSELGVLNVLVTSDLPAPVRKRFF